MQQHYNLEIFSGSFHLCEHMQTACRITIHRGLHSYSQAVFKQRIQTYSAEYPVSIVKVANHKMPCKCSCSNKSNSNLLPKLSPLTVFTLKIGRDLLGRVRNNRGYLKITGKVIKSLVKAPFQTKASSYPHLGNKR